MFTRVALSTIFVVGLFSLPVTKATKNDGPVASTTAVQRTDDPIPCPECDPGPYLSGQIATAADMRTDDPIPCPECDPGPYRGAEIKSAADMRTDDPIPCPECDPGPYRA